MVNNKKVTVSIATIPSRKEALKITIDSLINQVDKIYIYLNNYEEIPNYLTYNSYKLKTQGLKKIEYFRSQNYKDLGDVGKFHCVGIIKGYHFTCDDDIIYPDNYIKYMIEKGYYVIRVGAHAVNKVSYKNKMFIDYPFTKYVSDFNDMYIVANSSFLIGSTSGICDVATLFDVPRLVVNSIPFGHSTIGKKTMFIPKKISKKGDIMPYFDKHVRLLIDNFVCDIGEGERALATNTVQLEKY